MAENDISNDSSNSSISTNAESSFGWFPLDDCENGNVSHQNITDTSDTSSENDSIPVKSDLKSLKETLTIKKERYIHQLSDEDDSDSPELNSSKQKVPKQRKLEEGRKNDTSNKIRIDGTYDTTESVPFNLDSDDEIWMVQCPANLNASDLKGNNIDIGGISKFGTNYIGTTLRKKTDTGSNINLLIPNTTSELKSVPLAGHIIITLQVDVPPLQLPPIKNKISAPLPEGLKLRHPLLGIVNSNSETLNCDAPHIKHNKRKHKDIDSSQTTTYSDSEINSSPSKKKKKKQKKKKEQSESIETTPDIENNEFEDVIESSQATKTNKYSLNDEGNSEIAFPLTQYSDGIMETNLSSSERKKKKNRKKDKTESSVQDEGLESPTYFKKKKRKSDTDDSNSLLNTDNDCSMSLLNTSRSKNISKNHVYDQELTLKSHSSSPERRPLKRRHSDNEADSLSPKKKKKKFKLSYSQGGE